MRPRQHSSHLFFLLTAASAIGQVPYAWVDPGFTPRPFARQRHAMAFDLSRGETVLFGGFNGAYMSDTWTLGVNGWTRRTVSPAPTARADHAMAYDPFRQRVVLFGGSNGSELADIWEWDGSVWVQMASSVPGIGSLGAAAYDPVQLGTFYNRNSANILWDGTAATTVTVAQPTASMGHAIVFDAASGGLLTVNGSLTRVFAEPQGWQERNSSSTFSLTEYAMAVDAVSSRVIMHGGEGSVGSGSGPGFPVTWEWTGSVWSQALGAAPNLAQHAMVFDTTRRAFVMFGGRSQGTFSDTTWTLSTAAAADYETYGLGCGPTPVPQLRPDPLWSGVPVLGGYFFVAIDGLAPTQLALGLIGTSNQVWNGQPLPAPLGAVGMPGCELLVAPISTSNLGLSNAAGTASWVTYVPNRASLLGAQFYQQVLGIAPLANAAGIVWSNAGHGTAGLR